MKDPFILEIAVESTGGALAAERGGADRIELCASLRDGGLTPKLELMQEVRCAVKIPVHVMIRPRTGNFVYSAGEIEMMKDSIHLAQQLKMDGVVLGILRTDNTIDVQPTKELVEFARPMQVTFHRAFDECNDLFVALETAIATGSARILTCGGAHSVPEGIKTIESLCQKARNRIVILPGGGIQPANFAQIRRAINAKEFHSGLGTVLPYGTEDHQAFEEAVGALKSRRC